MVRNEFTLVRARTLVGKGTLLNIHLSDQPLDNKHVDAMANMLESETQLNELVRVEAT